uniref:hypothetical protein n=1 Tax=Psychroflexus aestuariivivens TaxID=1795040 RepID=UPI000FD82559
MKKHRLRLLVLSFILFFSKGNSQEFELYSQFNGSYDFTAIGNTLNVQENGLNVACVISTQSSTSLNLNPDQIVEAAYLFWSGSGDGSGNFTINLNNELVSADKTYSYIYDSPTSQVDLDFFGAMSDVTQIVQNTGNGNYTVSGINLNNIISAYCPTAQNYGGWAIIIVYEEASLGANQVNIYDGFEFVGLSNNSTTILLDNLNVVETDGAKIGFLAWEGDDALALNETLQFNGVTLSDLPLNPANNMFNGTNSYTGNNNLWNMDLDVLDIEDVIEVGDTQATINLNSDQDGVFLHHVATTISSELPDATVEITDTFNEGVCDNKIIDFVASVDNFNSTQALPENIPVSLFVIDENGNELYLGTEFTENEILINGSEDLVFSVVIPDNVPLSTQIIVRVNDDGTGNSIVTESNFENNEYIYDLQIYESPEPPILENLEECGFVDEIEFDLTAAASQINTDEFTISFYNSQIDAETEVNAIDNLDSYSITDQNETIWVRIFDGNCFAVSNFEIESLVPPQINDPTMFAECDFSDSQNGFASFNLSSKIDEITNNNSDYAVEFFTTQAEVEDLNIETGLSSPYTNDNAFSQTLFVRVTDINNDCVSFTSLELQVDLLPEIATPEDLPSLELCDEGNGQADFDLTQNNLNILNGLTATEHEIEFYSSESEADNDQNPITNPDNFTSPGQTIFVRVTEIETGCHALTSFDLLVLPLPDLNPPDPIRICDLDDDGQASFFLPVVESGLINAPENYSFSYHESQNDAENDQNPISDPDNFINTQSPIQTIYVLVTDTETGCQSTTNFEIEVLPVDFIPFALTDFEVCADTTDGIGIGLDLTSQEAFIFGETDNSDDYLVTYHLSQSDAAEGE